MNEQNLATEGFTATTSILKKATRVVANPSEKLWEILNRRNPYTGVPEGSLAIMKERIFMWMLRAKKSRSRPYRMRLA